MCLFSSAVRTLCSHLSQFLALILEVPQAVWGGNCQARTVGGSACAAGACLLWSPGYLVLLLQPLSCFPLGGPFPSSPPSVAGKPAHHIELAQPAGGGDNARWFSRLSKSLFWSSLNVTLALCTILTASCKPSDIDPAWCLIQRSQNLFPPCLDLEARPEINPDQGCVRSCSF